MAQRPQRTPQRKKPVVTAEEWQQVTLEAAAAEELLHEERFSFLRAYLETAKRDIVDYFVRNRIKAVAESKTVGDTTTTIRTTRREQEYELAGQYKFIEQLLSDLERITQIPDQIETEQAKGHIDIEGEVEK